MELLPAARVEALQVAPLTYAPVGGTATLAAAPAGYAWLRRTTPVGCGFDEAVERLMTWGVHERAGLRVRASADRVALDEVVEMRIPWLPGVRIPCRVVRLIETPDEVGFAYGTLPDHPESGEESFVVSRAGSRVEFTITAFSHPATWPARVATPLARRGQELFTRRYLAALGPG